MDRNRLLGAVGLALLAMVYCGVETSNTLNYIDVNSLSFENVSLRHHSGKVLGSTAVTYYVSTQGNDSNPGSISAPLRHISAAAVKALAGDTVIVLDGTYDNEGKVSPSYVVSLSNSGSQGAPITFMAQNRGRVILDSMNTTTGTACNGAYSYFNLSNASFIVIQGFVLQRSCDEGIHSNDTAHDITIKWNEFKNIANHTITDQYGRDGIYLNASAYNFIFDGNIFHDIGRTDGQSYSHFDHGIYSHGRNVTIINNIFYNINKGWCIQFAEGASDTLVANNTFAQSNPVTGEDGHIMFWDHNTNITVKNNIFDSPTGYALTRYTATVSGFVDHNLVKGVNSVISDPTGFSLGTNIFGLDPLFINKTNHDFHLSLASPAKDAGVAISQVAADIESAFRPQGLASDIGAYEFPVEIVQTDILPPSVPTGLLAVAVSSSQINLTWNSSIDNVGVTGYKIYRDGIEIAVVTTGNFYSDTGLTAGVSYSYTILALDLAGNISAQSSPVQATTFSPPPPPPPVISNGPWNTYFYSLNKKNNFGNLLLNRKDSSIDFDWGSNSPSIGVPSDNFAVRWTGIFNFPEAGAYNFTLFTDDGMRMWIDGVKVLDKWSTQVMTYNFTKTLSVGNHSIKVEYFEKTGNAAAKLWWSKVQ